MLANLGCLTSDQFLDVGLDAHRRDGVKERDSAVLPINAKMLAMNDTHTQTQLTIVEAIRVSQSKEA